MATLSQSMRLHDGVTPILRNIQRAMQSTLNAFEQMQNAANQPINNRDLEIAREAINDIGAAIRRAEQEQERLNQQMRQGGRSLNDANSNLDRMNRSINRATGSTDGLLGKLKQLAALSMITIAVKVSFDTFANFEQEMARVKAISGASAESYQLLENSARELGRNTTFSATEAAEGMKYLAMAGWEVDQIVSAMPGMLNLAAAGALDLGTTADIVSDTMTGFGMSAEKAMHVADVFAKTVTSTNTDIAMMGEAMKYAAPIAKQFGMDIEQTAAMIGQMANAGIKASQAGTAIRSGLLRLADPRARAEMQLEKLGLTFTEAGGKMKDIQQIIREVGTALEGLSESERLAAAQRIFGVEPSSGWLAIFDQGAEALDHMVAQLQNSDGVSQAMADTMNATLLGNLKLMGSYAQDAMIAVGLAMRDGLQAQDVGSVIIDSFKAAIDFIKLVVMSFIPFIVQIGVAFKNLQPIALTVFTILGAIIQGLGNALGVLGEIFNDVLEPLVPIIAGLVSAFVAYQAAVMGIAAAKGIAAGATALWTTVQNLATVAMMEYHAATSGATLAQLRLNMALIANPIGIVIGLIAALVGVLVYFWITNDNVAKGFLSAWYGVLNGIDQIGLAMKNIFYSVLNTVDQIALDIMKSVENTINSGIDKINGLIGVANKVPFININPIETVDLSSKAEEKVRTRIGERFNKLYNAQEEVKKRATEREEKLNNFRIEKPNEMPDLNDLPLLNALADLEAMENTIDNINRVDSVGSIDDEVNISDENLKLLEELVTRKYVNQISLKTEAPQTINNIEVNAEKVDAESIEQLINGSLNEQALSSTEQTYIKEY